MFFLNKTEMVNESINLGKKAKVSDTGTLITNELTYSINVSVNGTPLTNERVNSIEYTEIHDYENSIQPLRILTLLLSTADMLKVVNSKMTTGEFKGYIPIKITFTVTGSSAVKYPDPINTKYNFFAKPQGDEVKDEISENLNKKDPMEKSRNIADLNNNLQLILFTKEELSLTKINIKDHLYSEGTTLSSIFLSVMSHVCRGNKDVKYSLIYSPFKERTIGSLFSRNQCFLDALKRMEVECGFYKTQVMFYNEGDVIYFLNKDDNHQVQLKDSVSIVLFEKQSERNPMQPSTPYVDDANSVIANPLNMKTYKNELRPASIIFKNRTYRFPNGDKTNVNYAISRDNEVLNKKTNAEVEPKDEITYTEASFDLLNMDYRKYNPLTYIGIKNMNNGVIENFRLVYKEVNIKNEGGLTANIKAIKVVDRIVPTLEVIKHGFV